MNGADILVAAVLIAVVGADLYVIFRQRKSGKSACGCETGTGESGCGGLCALCGHKCGCPGKDKKH